MHSRPTSTGLKMSLVFIADADDARDKMNDDGEETPGMLHCCC